MILRFSARARAQLLAIEKYLRDEAGRGIARSVGIRIYEAAEILRHFPHAGKLGTVAGTREWVVRGYPYVIVYEFREAAPGRVTILGVFHCRQNRE